jgi:hypothetical protein
MAQILSVLYKYIILWQMCLLTDWLLINSRRLIMDSREKNTKERILEEALKLFSQKGYIGTSMIEFSRIFM